jgi:DNA-binding PadR family transcriptional regulator
MPPRRDRAFSAQTVLVLRALAAQPATWRYGYELGVDVGLKSGSLYPILMRLADRALLDTAWEQGPLTGRPPRHLYRLTPLGLNEAAALDQSPLARSAPALRSRPARGGAPA